MILIRVVGITIPVQIRDRVAGEEGLPIGLLSLLIIGIRKEITTTGFELGFIFCVEIQSGR
jgi:hypothetical protein